MMGENKAPGPRDLLDRVAAHVESAGPENIPVPQGPTEPASSSKPVSDRQTSQEVYVCPAGPARNGPTPPRDGGDRNAR